MSRIVFSKAAVLDRRELTDYTVARFGIPQAQRLRELFQATLTALAESPLMGRAQPELDPPGKTFRYLGVMKRFLIVYEPTADGIRCTGRANWARCWMGRLGVGASRRNGSRGHCFWNRGRFLAELAHGNTAAGSLRIRRRQLLSAPDPGFVIAPSSIALSRAMMMTTP